ncbi:MAG: response regulator receiver modulated PilZ sensor protein [Deltaproteobacteria bacterium]|nr:response regulator receiver modulated PilZ sensor protein [Deltaproteobacteria bacterium]
MSAPEEPPPSLTDEEKRRDTREPVTLFVEYEGAEDLIGDFTENLSSGGTFVTTNRDIPIGTQIQLVLSFPGLISPIAIDGVVRWSRSHGSTEGDAGAGIEFEPGPGRDQLASIVDRIRSRDPKTVSRTFRVLVVDDNRHVAELIQEGLRGSTRRDFGGGVSFVFRNAEDGRAAVEILRRETFDALIIDVYLPILDGTKVIIQARTELGLTALPIIAVSAGGDSARRSALEAGANMFLDKPMRLRQIIETMQRLLF